MSIQVSLFASSVRQKLWPALLKSLEGTSVECEIVFAGYRTEGLDIPELPLNLMFVWKDTGNIKPAQCYEIARRHCTGEVVVWIADDCEFPNDVIGKAYKYWKSKEDEKLILSIQTEESGYYAPVPELCEMKHHSFFPKNKDTVLMAPLGMMSRRFLDELGGLDSRYICGQYENDIVMSALAAGGKVEIFGDKDTRIVIDHLKKSIATGESADRETFLDRPFGSSFLLDRQTLEEAWSKFDQVEAFKMLDRGERPSTLRQITKTRQNEFIPYPNDISFTKSYGNNLPERWS